MEIAAGVAVALIVLVLIGIPMFARQPKAVGVGTDAEINAEVTRYRAAIKSKTLCERCLTPNPAKSNYCAECGRGL
jgi:hypothetical protein